MNFASLPSPPFRLSLLAALLCLSLQSQAQNKPERLSDWMLRQQPSIEYPLALMWLVPQEKSAQRELQKSLVQALDSIPNGQNLKTWIAAQSVTGRAIVPNTDPRWLQANLAQDPVLASDQQILAPARPKVVSVIRVDGTICTPLHQAGLTARSYIEACARQDAGSTQAVDLPSRVWIAQPDGRSFSYGIAAWNAEPQSELAPGAWLWAPHSDSLNVSDSFSQGFIRFLGSLGVSTQAEATTEARMPRATPSHLLRGPMRTASDWGEIGLLQTPTARMDVEGTMRTHISKVIPYTRTNIMFQPLPWLEAGFRYTDIGNRQYDPSGALQTTQTLKDKGFDFKLRLREESDKWPALALGMRDIGGTGLFSSEYLVANKRLGDLDVSLGLGWGYMGTTGNIKNPLSWLNSQYSSRPNATTSNGGEVGVKAFFKGSTSLFGGIQWRATDNLALKIERDSNHYQNEPSSNNQIVRSPWNFGATYRYGPVTDLSVGLERGNKLMLGVTFNTQLDGVSVPKFLTPARPTFEKAGSAPANALELAQLLHSQTGWDLLEHKDEGNSWRLVIGSGGMHWSERLERINGLVQARAPEAVKRWSIQFVQHGIAMHAVEVDRRAWITSQTQAVPISLKPATVLSYAPLTLDSHTVDLKQPIAKKPEQTGDVEFSFEPNFRHIIGGPDAFYLYRLGADATATYKLDASTWITGTLSARMIDNFHIFKFTGPSNLPRVRTYQREFETSSRVTMPLLQATHVKALSQDQFASVYAGYLEQMYAGVGAEWLYRPWQSRVALGVDVNHVVQRDFNQNFALRDYRATTGHAAVYWDTGLAGVNVKLQVGQYLAGDRGATLDVSRRFNNGILLGAYATKTNVSADQFGEGSFDKGIYLTIPFDVMLPKYSNKSATVGWSPLTRDGGARLQRFQELYKITSGRDPDSLNYGSTKQVAFPSKANADMSGDFSTPKTLIQEITNPPIVSSVVSAVQQSASTVSQQLTHPDSRQAWLWGAGLVLGASLLDERVDRWSLNHAKLSGVAKLGNAVPLLLGIGALADLSPDGVGWTALKSAGFTLATNQVLRYSFGRARPFEGQGHERFDPFRAQGLKSSFASNHVAAAFALATPFAQTYDMPWLYGAAAMTALARIQTRQHWLSDTVAGGVLGYAVGSVMSDEQKQNSSQQKSGRQLWISPNGIAAKWWWE